MDGGTREFGISTSARSRCPVVYVRYVGVHVTVCAHPEYECLDGKNDTGCTVVTKKILYSIPRTSYHDFFLEWLISRCVSD